MRALHTPMTMAVLGLLRERPRHPYEMQALLRERHVGSVVKLRGASLYDAIQRLVKAGFVEPIGTARDGARPERTVYALTDSGAAQLDLLVRGYLGTVEREHPVFVAGLAHILHLDREDAADLLRQRANKVQAELESTKQALQAMRDTPRVVLLEVEYAQTVRQAELTWLRQVVSDVEDGTLSWIEQPERSD